MSNLTKFVLFCLMGMMFFMVATGICAELHLRMMTAFMMLLSLACIGIAALVVILFKARILP